MGARLHRAAEQERAVQEGRRPAQRPRPDPLHLLQARLRLDRPGRPARPLPLDGPLHPARPRLRRRQDRAARGGGARRPLLHDARAHRRRAARRRGAARARRDRRRRTPATPPTSPTARTSSTTGSAIEDVPAIWERLDAVGLSSLEACGDSPRPFLGSPVAGVAKDEIIDGTAALEEIKRRVHRQPGVLQPAAQVQDRADRPPRATTSPPRSTTSSFVGTVHPEHGPGFDLWVGGGLSTNPMLAAEARRLDPARRGRRRLGGRRRDLPRLRLPPAALAGPAEVPGRRLGRGEVPRGARERVPPPRARRQPLPRVARSARATTSASTSRRTAASTSAPRRSSAASTAPR